MGDREQDRTLHPAVEALGPFIQPVCWVRGHEYQRGLRSSFDLPRFISPTRCERCGGKPTDGMVLKIVAVIMAIPLISAANKIRAAWRRLNG